MQELTFIRDRVGPIRLHVLPTDRFKTFAVSMFMGRKLEEDTVTPTALAPFVLRRGNAAYPETKRFREALDHLYGAGFGFDIYKRGDAQIVQFRMDVINDKFVQDDRSLLAETLSFLGETITNPHTEQGGFSSKYVEEEKETLRKRLDAVVNDKIRYAAERCIEEMCEGEPYRLHPLGNRDQLKGLDAENLYTAYQAWIREAALDLYVVGDVSMDAVKELVAKHFRLSGGEPAAYPEVSVRAGRGTVKTVTDRLDVKQGKLNLGLRLPITYAHADYPAALMYNGILGGYPHSKMFVNVREKASLAYYASSRFDGHKGILTIQSGIEFEKYEQALAIMKEQLEAMKRGDISDVEYAQTQAMIANHVREIQDSAHEMIGFDFNAVLSGKTRTPKQLLEAVKSVSRDQIRAVAEQVELDTVYFLRDRKEGDAHADEAL
ncbi:peptidase M16 [Xylanibacillus composti]|uniref:Peptidase M16 n=1 Tax=Xylanibacillus composti TaxID=1572762 RepID=A0A8J4H0F0_9BACL|nr:peptidase M16 [Xylanibacillus composti]